MKFVVKSVFLGFILVLVGCGGTKYTNAYKRIQESSFKFDNPSDIVALDFSSKRYQLVNKKKTYKGIFELSELGQYKLISEYSKKDSTSKLLRASLIESLEKKPPKTKKIVDDSYLSFPTRFTFFIDDKLRNENQANRIMSLKLTVILKSDGLQFEKFEGFLTKYEYYDFGSIENTSTRNFSLGATVGAGTSTTSNEFDDNGNQVGSQSSNFGPSITGSYGAGNTLKENVVIKKRVISQTGSLSSEQMDIYLEGNPLKNLNGPITVEFTLASNPLSSLTEEIEFLDFVAKPKVIITPRYFVKVDDSQNVEADVFMEWTYRRVISKGNTSFEGDDIIELLAQDKYKYKSDVKLFNSNDLQKNTYGVELSGENRLFVQKNQGKKHELRFLSQDNAIAFVDYVYEKNTTMIAGYKIVDIGGNQIPIAKIQNLEIKKEKF